MTYAEQIHDPARGWDLALLGLDLHLGTGDTVDQGAAAAFPLTPAGTTFVQEAASSWGVAAIADGDAPEAARAAADRSVAFYTTDPADEPAG